MLATSHNFQTPEVFQTRINDFLSLQSIRFHSNFYSTKFKFFLFVNIQKKKKKKNNLQMSERETLFLQFFNFWSFIKWKWSER